ncbi:SDR family NAD(P)-dependent oxidoreductase [Rhizorhabdus histidinilytica]|uniref:SDR family NAD(P)-dependent oxidoreductase n=1 Tax=Rhizorhabdus histidinilytica TaxID=439228 RepID=UPI0036064D32
MSNRMAGKVALVTGAASGLGAAQARLFAKEGAKVVVADLNVEMGNKVVAEIQESGGEALFVRLDITDAASWAGAVEAAVGAFGKLTTLYNTAGIIHGAMIQDETLEGWSKMIAVNQTALFLGLKIVAPEIAKSGNGAILNISSLVSVICEPGLISYAATKSAVRAMTKVAALEYVGQGVRVNTIVPGGVKTPIQANVTPEQVEWYKAQIPMGDLGEPNDIAYGALYLLSDEAKYVTGTELFIDGGWSSAA